MEGGEGGVSKGGVFITFEGCDCSGKSTQIVHLVRKLEGMGQDLVVTREPGGTPFGEKIRDLLLNLESPDRDILSEVFLYAAARAEIVAKVIRPALEQGRIVISERYADSTWVYQGYAGGVSLSVIENINTIATGGLEPDLTLIFDINGPLVLKERFEGKTKDKIESRSEEYHQKVREGYRVLAERFPHRTVIIDADADICEVQNRVWKEVSDVLARKGYDLNRVI
jgi:dTMP kinase